METRTYRFGPYELNPRTRELFKHGIRVKLRPQPFRVLEVLLERPGDVVTREELRQRLWPGDAFVDDEHGLNTSIKELRQALRDSPSEPRYIETLPKVGYRMVASAVSTEVEAASAELETQPLPAESGPDNPPPGRMTGQRRGLVAAAVALVLLIAALGVWKWQHLWRRAQPAATRLMLAVLPFENLTGDPGQEYLSDGLTEEMITQLGRLNPERFGVIARTSAMHYKRNTERVEQIGRELNVQYVLEGSLRKDASRIRVTAQLIRVNDETRTWARQYDREWTGLLAMQGEIAREISDEIQVALGERPAKRAAVPAQQSEAYDFYLKGLYFLNKRTGQDFRRAIDYFHQAIVKDPNHGPSYAGMADCYALLEGYSGEVRPEYMIKARSAALRALEIDPNLPEAHTALAVIVQNYDRDWQTAGNEYRRAINLNPSYAMGHHWYAEHLGYLGRFEEAFRESELARQLDPLSLIISADNAMLLYYSRQYDRAIEKFRAVKDLDPNFPRAGELFLPYLGKGMLAEALEQLKRAESLYGDQPFILSDLAYTYGRSGRRQQALRAVENLKQRYRPQETDPALLVTAYLGLGDKEQAFAWLEKAFAQHSNMMTTLKVDPLFDPLRGDSRFQDLLRRVDLAPQ